ncbi:DUF4358 domain-containing protein [Paenibacillus soyae]|uniref:DUF4358 domain-containing protein n=1 Tax=Paenibacillus soyae TaxID=2969249 RepID=A0A9X2S8Z0_9BACL|nr:DUF4358 domain-containing protein [Paenibacillus soyae]MCR2804591.1 DUF4358 domain-containing protein [Paenibacillus soyae]
MMKKRVLHALLIAAMGIALAACGADNEKPGTDTGANQNSSSGGQTDTGNGGNEPSPTDEPDTGSNTNAGGKDPAETDNGGGGAEAGSTEAIVEAILSKVEQPSFMPVEGDMVKDMYHFDPTLLEQYTIMTPLMNVKTNEIAVLKVKDVKDIPVVEEGVKQRAADVQKMFETYLQDQYENAKNYKLVTKGSYVLFVISESADQIIDEFEALVP